MYYNIEVINKINLELLIIVVNRIQYLTRNNTGILMLNNDPDSHLLSGCADQTQNRF